MASGSKEKSVPTISKEVSRFDVSVCQDEEDEDEGTHIEDAIVATEYGWFHYMLVLTSGAANASDAVELLCVSILLPAAQCDLAMTSEDKGWLNGSIFFGMMIGGYVWGSLGDVYGRRRVLVLSLLVNAVAGLLSSLMQTFPTFLLMRLLSGVGVGGSIPLVWAYVSEFQPARLRGRVLSIVATFWLVGNVAVAGLALAVIPLQARYDGPWFSFSSWRLFLIICALPSLFIGLALLWFPESPMFLTMHDRRDEALIVLQGIYARNTGRRPSDYPVHKLRRLATTLIPTTTPTVKCERRWGSGVRGLALRTVKQTMALFTSSLVRVTCLLAFINFTLQYGYYGLWLWFPELFNRLEMYHDDHPNEEVTVCEMVTYDVGNSTVHDPCADPDGPVDTKALINILITSVAPLPTNLWTIYHMDKLGRKFFLVLSMVLSSASVFGIYLVSSTLANLLLSCLFGAASTMAFNALDCLGVELFPTQLRSTALAVTLLAARIGAICGNVSFGYLLDTSCIVPIMLVVVLMLVGGFVGLLLPNTTRVPLT